jgi:hypothetical protein
MAKTAPPLSLRYIGAGSPSLHRDSFMVSPEARYQDSARCLRRVTTSLQAGSSLKTPTGCFINAQPYCRAVMGHASCTQDNIIIENFLPIFRFHSQL